MKKTHENMLMMPEPRLLQLNQADFIIVRQHGTIRHAQKATRDKDLVLRCQAGR